MKHQVDSETVTGENLSKAFDTKAEAEEFISETRAMGLGAVKTTEALLEALGLSEDEWLTESGNHSSGFWHNELKVDLEALKAGSIEAFRVVKDVHDTAGVSFRQYHGIDIYANLPDGVTAAGIVDLCLDIYNRYAELTEGFDVEWDGSDWVGRWYDEDGDRVTQGPEWPALSYWESFSETVQDLDSCEVYDLSEIDNYPFVFDEVEPRLTDTMTVAEIVKVVEEMYVSDSDTLFVGHRDFAERVVEERD